MKLVYIPILGIIVTSIASAGSIEIGAGNSSGITTSGLTTAYIGAGLNGWAEKSYVTNLFTNDTLSAGGGLTGTAANLPGVATQQFTDPNNGITFGMLNDGSNPGMNYLASPAETGSQTSVSIVVPIGLSGYSGAYIMLNDYFGPAGVADTTVSFNFAGGPGTVNVPLTNGNQIDSSHTCNPVLSSPTACPGYSGTTTSTGTDIVWSSNYVNTGGTSTQYNSTSGTASLIDLSFNLSAYSAYTLTSITITDALSYTSNTVTPNLDSRLALSAITLTTPEPSTVLLLLTGLGLMGFASLRRKVKT